MQNNNMIWNPNIQTWGAGNNAVQNDPQYVQNQIDLQNFLSSQQQPVQNAPSSTTGSAFLDSVMRNNPVVVARGAGRELNEIVGGLQALPQTGRALVDYYRTTPIDQSALQTANYINPLIGAATPYMGYVQGLTGQPISTPQTVYSDIGNAVLQPYGLTINSAAQGLFEDTDKSLGQKIDEQAGKTVDAMANYPVSVLLDTVSLIPLGQGTLAGSIASRVGRAASKVIPFSRAKQVQRALDVTTSKTAQQSEKVISKLDDIAQTLTPEEYANVLQSAEQGVPLPKSLEPSKEALRSAMSDYHDIVPIQFKADPKKLAVAQKIARDNNITYDEAVRQVQGIEDLANSATVPLSTAADRGQTPESFQSVLRRFTNKEGTLPEVIEDTRTTKELVSKPEDFELISREFTLESQPEVVQEGLRKVFDEEELAGLRGLTGDQIYNAAIQKFGSAEAASDTLREAGIKGLNNLGDSSVQVFGGHARGGFDPVNNKITLWADSNPITKLHENFHWYTNELKKFANRSKHNAAKLRRQIGFDIGNYNNKALEDLVDNFVRYIQTGEMPLNADIANFYRITANGLGVSDTRRLAGLQALADGGNNLAAQVLNAERYYDEGKIFPVVHAGEEASVTSSTVSDLDIDPVGRMYAGRFSERVLGDQSYEELAKNLTNSAGWIQENLKKYTEGKVTDELLGRGTIGGQDITLGTTGKNLVYLDVNKLKKGQLKAALSNPVQQAQAKAGFIPIDKHVANELAHQLFDRGSSFTGFIGDLVAAFNRSMLAQGTYLAGNAWTGLTNAVLNSGFHLLDDMLAAMVTRGKIAKSLGIERIDRARKAYTPIGQAIQNFNDLIGGNLLRYLDRNIQNSFAEIAGNERLRRMGVLKPEDRVAAIQNMSAEQLADTINDVRQAALLNGTATILPRTLAPVAEILNPFWRWTDTATQSTVHMLRKNPIIANAVISDYLTDLAWNQETQRREKLGVVSEDGNYSIKLDPKTGKVMETTIEVLPMISSLKFVNSAGKLISGNSKEAMNLLPAGWGQVIAAAQGKNRYGTPLRNPDLVNYSGKRYRRTPQGWVEEIGGTPNEVLISAINSTIGLGNMVNRTLAPIATGILNSMGGTQYNFYQPYAGSLFGEILPEGITPNNAGILFGGDPLRQRSGEDIMNTLFGSYEIEHYPDRDNKVRSERNIMGILRARARQNRRIQESVNE